MEEPTAFMRFWRRVALWLGIVATISAVTGAGLPDSENARGISAIPVAILTPMGMLLLVTILGLPDGAFGRRVNREWWMGLVLNLTPVALIHL
jgi:hypothetical protein